MTDCRLLRRAALALSLTLLAACGTAGAADRQPDGTLGGVGVLPDQSAGAAGEATATPSESTTPRVVSSGGSVSSGAPGSSTTPPIADQVTGNRLLMVGDSIFAATASRYGGEACATLVPLDWQVDVEAESGRAIDFGERVVRQMMPQGWDVVVFFLGTNYGGNEVGYRQYLVKTLDEIGPDVPVVLLTTTVYADKQNEVNDIIRDEASRRPNVTVLDWGAISEQPGMLAPDGYHPSDAGRQVMVDAISLLVGRAPVAPGKCLSSKNRSDVPNTPGAPTTTKPRSSGGSATTTTKPAATATTNPSTGSTTVTTAAAVTSTTVRSTSTIATTHAPASTSPTSPPTQPTSPPTQPTSPPTQPTSPSETAPSPGP